MTRRQLVALLATSYLARVPVTAIPLGLILVARADGHPYSDAGLLIGVYTLALSVTSPLLGGLADRFGAPAVFGVGAPTCALALATIGLEPAHTALPVLLVLAAVAGAALPPLGALTRGLLTPRLSAERRARVFAIDATAQELCFISGPLVLALGVAVASARISLVALGAFQVVGAIVFWLVGRTLVAARVQTAERPGSPLRSGALRTLLAIALMTGALFGAFELAITAALDAAGQRNRAGLLLGIWSGGSLVGGLLNVRWPTADTRRRLTGSLVLSIVAASLTAVVSGHPWALALALLVAGIVQAPLMACCYVLVPLFARNRVTEAFGWLTSAVVGGIAIGSALAGGLVNGHGAEAGFAIGVVAPLLALALVRGPLARASGLIVK